LLSVAGKYQIWGFICFKTKVLPLFLLILTNTHQLTLVKLIKHNNTRTVCTEKRGKEKEKEGEREKYPKNELPQKILKQKYMPLSRQQGWGNPRQGFHLRYHLTSGRCKFLSATGDTGGGGCEHSRKKLKNSTASNAAARHTMMRSTKIQIMPSPK
jgi:hypothetical protein